MHRVILGSLLALTLSTSAMAQEWAKKMFEVTSHDFGTVAKGAKVDFGFKFQNKYEEDVHVEYVSSSCGCTTPTIAKNTLKTWETGEVLATFNTEAFLAPEKMIQGQFGNAGRNTLIGPGFSQWDVALLKNFRMRERMNLQFRAESFNLWNHAAFTGINATVRFDAAGKPTQNYGAVTSSGPGRILSFGLKLLF